MIRIRCTPATGLILGVLIALGHCPAAAAGEPATPRPRLGLTVADGRFVDGTPGVIVTAVAPRSPAARARSRSTGRPQPIGPGDMVVGFAGDVVNADGTFAARVAAASGRVELVIQSRADRRLQRLVVDLPPADAGGTSRLSIGLVVRGCDSGIHIEAVEPGSPAAAATEGKTGLEARIAPDSHLLSINGQPVSTPAEAADRLAAADGEIHVEIERPASSGQADPPIILCVLTRTPSAASAPASGTR